MSDLSALREAVDLVIERCECGDSGCPFRTPGGMTTNGGCRMAHDRVRGHQLAALGALFKAARALLSEAPPAEAMAADVWRTEAERLRGLLGQMIGEAIARPGPHLEWAKQMEREMEKSP